MAVWKQLPYEFYEVDAIEAWLDEQVSQGLSLKKHFGRFYCFERTSDGMTRYRINVLPKKKTQSKSERIDAYREMGWEYVMELSSRLEIYRALRPDAAEMNTDEDILNEALRSYVNNRFVLGIAAAVFVLFSFSLNLFLSAGGIFTVLLKSGIGTSILFFIDFLVIFLSYFFMLQPAVAMRKRKMLARDYHSPAVFAHRRRRWRILLILAVMILPGLFMTYRSTKSNYFPSEEYQPIVAVEDICPAAESARENAHRVDSSTEHTVSYQQIGPTAHIPDKNTPDLYASAFYYTIDHSTIRWQWLAAGYAREQTRGWESVKVYGYDGAWYRIGDNKYTERVEINYQSLILLKGNEIIEINYQVNDPLCAADLHDAIPLLAYK